MSEEEIINLTNQPHFELTVRNAMDQVVQASVAKEISNNDFGLGVFSCALMLLEDAQRMIEKIKGERSKEVHELMVSLNTMVVKMYVGIREDNVSKTINEVFLN